MSDVDPPESDSEACLRQNIQELLKFYGWNQTEFAARLGKDQSWVSRHLSAKPPPKGARFQFEDLDLVAAVFGLSPAELLAMRRGKWDRRTGKDRRCGYDRRGRRPFKPAGMLMSESSEPDAVQ